MLYEIDGSFNSEANKFNLDIVENFDAYNSTRKIEAELRNVTLDQNKIIFDVSRPTIEECVDEVEKFGIENQIQLDANNLKAIRNKQVPMANFKLDEVPKIKKLTVEEWKNLDLFFEVVFSDFYFAHSDYRNGSNKKQRDAANRKMHQIINRADFKLQDTVELYNQYTGGEIANAYDRACIYDEFKDTGYFGRNINTIQEIIKERIKTLS